MDLKSLLNQALNSDLLKQGADALGKQTQNIKSSSSSSQFKTLGAGAIGGGLIGKLSRVIKASMNPSIHKIANTAY